MADARDILRVALGHHQAGRLDVAEPMYRQVLAAEPANAMAMHLLGVVCGQCGRPAEAVEWIGKAIAILPGDGAFWGNLGRFLMDLGRFEKAAAATREAIRLGLRTAPAYDNLGNALAATGRLTEAIEAHKMAISLDAGLAEAHHNLAHALKQIGDLLGALAEAELAIGLRPRYGAAHMNRGLILAAMGKLDEGIAALQRATDLEPQLAAAHNNLGMVLKDAGELDRAMAAFGRAVELDGAYAGAHSNLLLALHMDPASTAESLLARHKEWETRHARGLAAEATAFANTRETDRRLRIGYVSADFCDHPVGRFILPLLAGHDAAKCEVTCYADVPVPDAMTAKLRGHAAQWRPIAGMPDEAVAAQVRGDGIDILVDLSLHTAGSRLRVFARRPAPVQVTYLGYPSTTGLAAMDYRLTDGYLDPEGEKEWYAERSIRLTSYWCFAPDARMGALGARPAASAGHVTFGCLNNFCKVSAPALAAWCAILRRVADSRLLLHAPEGAARLRVLEACAREGVDGGRIAFAGRLGAAQYFAAYNGIDIALDPFPFGGGTTTCDALWMGVPVVTLSGRTAVGRAGVSLLSNAGLPALVAQGAEEYVEKAATLARDVGELGRLREGMRKRMADSALMDAGRFCREVEAAYRRMWTEWARA